VYVLNYTIPYTSFPEPQEETGEETISLIVERNETE
jgi:hypothetical protein